MRLLVTHRRVILHARLRARPADNCASRHRPSIYAVVLSALAFLALASAASAANSSFPPEPRMPQKFQVCGYR